MSDTNHHEITTKLRDLIARNRIEEAFETLCDCIDDNEQAVPYFLELMSNDWNLCRLVGYTDQIKAAAEQGNKWMQYAWARYHDSVVPLHESAAIKREYFKKALEAGVSDARMYLAFAWRDGDFGTVNRELFVSEREKAIAEGSQKAWIQKWNDLIYGTGSMSRNPELVCRTVTEMLNGIDEEKEYLNPTLYRLVGKAFEALEEKETAEQMYRKAAERGDNKAWYHIASLYQDVDGHISDYDKYSQALQKGMEMGAADAFLYAALAIPNEEAYQQLDEEEKQRVHELYDTDCQMSYKLGDPVGAFALGNAYRFADYGFEQDYQEAWKWYSAGAALRCGYCYLMLAEMIDEGLADGKYDHDYRNECMLQALRLGVEDARLEVVKEYYSGGLASHAKEIRKYYLPDDEKEEINEEDNDSHFPDEDGRYDAWA